MDCGGVTVLNTQTPPLLATFTALYVRCFQQPSEESVKEPVLLLGSELNRAESYFCAAQLLFI